MITSQQKGMVELQETIHGLIKKGSNDQNTQNGKDEQWTYAKDVPGTIPEPYWANNLREAGERKLIDPAKGKELVDKFWNKEEKAPICSTVGCGKTGHCAKHCDMLRVLLEGAGVHTYMNRFKLQPGQNNRQQGYAFNRGRSS